MQAPKYIGETKVFPLRDALSVVTGRLLTKPRGRDNNGISDLYDILDWMTGVQTVTHQIPRVLAECREPILRWYPELGIDIGNHLGTLDRRMQQAVAITDTKLGRDSANDKRSLTLAVIEQWLQDFGDRVGCHELAIGKIANYKAQNPIEELVQMISGSNDQ